MSTSSVLRFPIADPADAARFFAAELAFDVDPDDVAADMRDGVAAGYQLIECRNATKFAELHIPGAINFPYWTMDEHTTASLDRDLLHICYCESFQCNAATQGALRLAELGFRVKRLAGGITTWRAAGFPVAGTHTLDA
ncbi:rhodanese-like domain-containing protein [Labedaea rhizosphaerae]|nr:rhodanese-like domain-containing protein [Labedaea rhizosphaerae]